MSRPVVAALVYNLGHQEPWVELEIDVLMADGIVLTRHESSRIVGHRLRSVCTDLREASAAGTNVDDSGVRLLQPVALRANQKNQQSFVDIDWDAFSGEVREIRICGWYAPMLRAVVGAWRERIEEGDVSLSVILLGTETSDKSKQGADTAPAALLLGDWVRRAHPELQSVRYVTRPNDPFLIQSVYTTMQALRDEISQLRRDSRDEEGKPHFSAAWSASTGTGAVTSSLHHALSHLKPHVFHVANAYRKFLRDEPIAIEAVAYRDIEHQPFVAVSELPDEVQSLQREMVQFRDEVARYLDSAGSSEKGASALAALDNGSVTGNHEHDLARNNEIKGFWLRKSQKPVLAVLEVERPDGTREYVRGMNLEVSMPTGSLCAERNAIGTALAQRPGLMRREIRRVAVLSAYPGSTLNPLPPCGACREWLLKIAEVQPDFEVVMFRDYQCREVQRKPVEE